MSMTPKTATILTHPESRAMNCQETMQNEVKPLTARIEMDMSGIREQIAEAVELVGLMAAEFQREAAQMLNAAIDATKLEYGAPTFSEAGDVIFRPRMSRAFERAVEVLRHEVGEQKTGISISRIKQLALAARVA